jgi:hypothetical protein
MLKKLQQRYTRRSKPRAHTYTSLTLWAVLGFALGFSPIIIFLGFFPAAKNDKPVPGQAAQGVMAHQPPARTGIETAASLPAPATTGQALPAPAPAQAQPTTLSAATPTPVVTATPATVAVHETAGVSAATGKKPADKKTAPKTKAQKTVKRPPDTKNAGLVPAEPPAASQPVRRAAPRQRPEAGADSIVTTIVYQSWEQDSPGSVFPQARVIDCSTGNGDVVCWTDVLTGQRHSREYRYKIKIIFDKFRADKQFVMTYRNLVLSSGGKPSNEETGALGALPENMQPGWEPMIHRLPCQLARQDKIICHPVGEARFAFKSTAVKTSLKK